ncbi:MAG: hypothetical protein P4L93_01785 [Coriobacteriia bacterium]|nr:hypothetical protein [Coriobacteriia bacterium]
MRNTFDRVRLGMAGLGSRSLSRLGVLVAALALIGVTACSPAHPAVPVTHSMTSAEATAALLGVWRPPNSNIQLTPGAFGTFVIRSIGFGGDGVLTVVTGGPVSDHPFQGSWALTPQGALLLSFGTGGRVGTYRFRAHGGTLSLRLAGGDSWATASQTSTVIYTRRP